jgi:hypothetical protein
LRTFGSGRRVSHVEIDCFRGKDEGGKRVRFLSSLIGINGDTPQPIY